MPEAPPAVALTVRSESVQRAYSAYRSDQYRVNRRYQRKLVWSVEEKQRLIDSIVLALPLPLFLVAETSSGPDATLELIDGMQRLNAIFSFIEQEYEYKGGYFDLDTLADTKALKDSGALSQKTPIVSREVSVAISNYSLALSVFRAEQQASVDEVFRRINSGGRRLSKQELRQAGTLSTLADLVRQIASTIRGDNSPGDVIPLRKMPLLSISNRGLGYGVNVNDIFWVRQNILRSNDVRESLDEQLILDMVLDCLIDPLAASTGSARDAAYDFEAAPDDPAEDRTASTISINALVSAYGAEKLIADFLAVHDDLRSVLDQGDDGFSRLIGLRPSGRSARYYHALFIALWELRFKDVRHKRRVHDPLATRQKLRNLATHASITSGGDWRAELKRQTVDAFKGIVLDSLEEFSETDEDLQRFGWATHLEQLLTNALVEQQSFDCKQGLHRLDSAREFDADSFNKILRTLTAISNVGPESTGYVVLGVADSEMDALRVRELDGISASTVREFRVVGIGREATLRGTSLNDYWAWIIQRISSSSDIPSWMAANVARDARLVTYKEKSVAVLKVRPATEVAFYKNQLWDRAGSESVEVPAGPRLVEVIGRFA
ncbi:DUF262 domain-containing protein [Brachybacterium sp. J153]|uniref:DUF262 domain-containing protein n=1 Tax=Brachybacterium sp. J153 TaxID=3116488 RepID=UPI002E79637D|nr:DUF262 domain-containing protein [Brachybacterium sp. J153]MEE1617020.1 DUF262 domain-containing protein [Brachybacterium sp. J153]